MLQKNGWTESFEEFEADLEHDVRSCNKSSNLAKEDKNEVIAASLRLTVRRQPPSAV